MTSVLSACTKRLCHFTSGVCLLFAIALLTGLLLVTTGCHQQKEAVAPPALTTEPLVHVPADLGTQALERVTALCELGLRDATTPGAEKAAVWLAMELEKLGLNVIRDSFEDETPEGLKIFHNVLGTLPGETDEKILFLSHFDTKVGVPPDFIGANDSGSSTGLLLAMAKWLCDQPRHYGLIFGFTDGEECLYSYGANDGLHGSRRLARQMKIEKEPIRAVILLDMIGDDDLRFTLPRNSTSELKLLFLDATVAQGCRDRVIILDHDILDDHQPFLDHGFAAIDLIDFHFGSRPGANDFWHTPEDTLDKVSAESLRQVGAVALEMIRRLDVQALR